MRACGVWVAHARALGVATKGSALIQCDRLDALHAAQEEATPAVGHRRVSDLEDKACVRERYLRGGERWEVSR